ncbi:MAG TPA: phosphonopyruvate decarboxylase [Hyphomicrobiaceae bacterium]|nr:phosphonopyruvate decarboxylase [Hyphomicrobiaceae bacterium]
MARHYDPGLPEKNARVPEMAATMTEDEHAKEISVGWQNQLYEALRRHDVTQFSYVPDAGHRICIDRSIADKDVHSIALTTEEEGVAIACGAHLGGKRSVLLMQSSGLGNCVNFMSMVKNGRFPFLTILSMRGDFGEGNPWQMGMGQAARKICESLDFIVLEVTKPEEVVPTIDAAANMVWKSGQAVAVFLSQRLIGAKAF